MWLRRKGKTLELLKSADMVNCVMSERQVVTNRRTVVLGIGNLLLKDEGVGVHLVQKLACNWIETMWISSTVVQILISFHVSAIM